MQCCEYEGEGGGGVPGLRGLSSAGGVSSMSSVVFFLEFGWSRLVHCCFLLGCTSTTSGEPSCVSLGSVV